MRLDRFITLLVPGGNSPRRSETSVMDRRLPVLMYHSLSDDHETVGDYFKLCTSPVLFRSQMHWLNEAGYVGVTLKDGLQWLNGADGSVSRWGGRQPVVVTFDDALRDFFTEGLPVLSELGFGATMYVPTAYIGDPRKLFKDRECMTWKELGVCLEEGVELGSHTRNHPKLHGMGWTEINQELASSKADLEQHLPMKVEAFAYPFAFPFTDRPFVSKLHELLQSHGYRTCVTTVVGRAVSVDSPLEVKRLPVNSADDRALLLAKVAGKYDWVGKAQTLFKFGRNLLSPRAEST